MKKILLITVLMCFAFALKSQTQLISINDIFKLTECNNNSCMIKMSKQLGFTFDDNDGFSEDKHCSKNRSELGVGKQDKLTFGIKQYWNSILFETNDPNIETEYKRLIANGEFKQTEIKKSTLGGTMKNFVSKNYPEYSASLSIDKISGVTFYSISIMRWIK